MDARAVERRVVSVLFADLVGFTALSERLDAEDVALVQDAYFAAARDTIARHGGVLEKFVGDAVMAVFGIPRSRDDDVERAVRAGLALIAAVDRLNASLDLDEGRLRLRVGVNTGEAVVGEGSAERGPVTGDTVNVAARLQAAAEPGTLVAGEVTGLALAELAELDPLPPLTLKGKSEPLRAVRVVSLHGERSRERALGRMRAPTLGREQELAALDALVGTTGRLLVVAPPGVGKSRLVSELSGRAGARGAVTLTARLRPDVLSPFEPVAQLLAAGGGAGALAAALAATADPERGAVVAELLTSAVAPRADLHVDQEQLFAAWLEGLDALAGAAPAVWIVEDVHWASPDLLAFLALAGETARPEGRVVVATARPGLLESAPHWAASGTVQHLEPIADGDARGLIVALAGAALPAALVERVAERSGGNALFIEELLRMWASAGVLVPDAGGWKLAAAADEVPFPPTVQAIYAGQLDDLPDSARTAVRRAAVAGRRFPAAALPVLDVDAPEEALDALLLRGLVTGPAGDPHVGDSYSYRHALLRDAGYASLARAERAELHLRLAGWLASLEGTVRLSRAEVVARHYAAALETAPRLLSTVGGRTLEEIRAEAAEWFERAAAAAAAVAAWDTATGLARRSVELTPPDARFERARRLAAQGRAAAGAVGADEALALLHEALAEFRALHAAGEPSARTAVGETGWAVGNLLRSQTLFETAERLADDLLAELGEPVDVAVARLLVLRAYGALNARDDFAAARRDTAQALAAARAGGDSGLELEATQLQAQVEAETGSHDGSLWDELAATARSRGRWDVAAYAVRARSSLDWDDDPAASLPLIDEAAGIARVHGLTEEAAWAEYARSESYLSLGEWDTATEVGLRAIEAAEARNLHRVVVRTWFVLRPIACARGRHDLLERAFPRFAARRGAEPDSPYARIVTTAVHLAFAGIGLEPRFVPEVEERLASFDLDHATPSWLAGIEAVVLAWLAAGELDGAEAALDRMRASFAERSPTRLATATEQLLRGRLLARRGRLDEAVAAADAARAAAAPWWRAKAERLLAELTGSEEARAAADRLERSLGIAG